MGRNEIPDVCFSSPKYNLGGNIEKSTLQEDGFRTIQLTSVCKLTTDFYSVFTDFPVNERIPYGKGVGIYDRYVIKVQDSYGTELNIMVHHRGRYAYLCAVGMKQLGNTVTVSVIQAIAEKIREVMAGA